LKNDEYIPNENYFLMKLFSYEIIMLAAIDYISIVVKNKKKNIILLETTDIKLLITIYIDISLQLLLK